MRHRSTRRALRPKASLRAWPLLFAIGVLAAAQAKSETPATNPGEEALWQAETVLQIAAHSDYAAGRRRLTRRDAIVATMEVRFASSARPHVATLAIEYGFDDEQIDTLSVAGMFTHEMPKWTAEASLFYERAAPPSAGDWHYWGSVRRRIADRHSLGVELCGAVATGRPAKWTLGYYGTISETLSVSVAAGSGSGPGLDWMTRTSVAWRLRPGRH